MPRLELIAKMLGRSLADLDEMSKEKLKREYEPQDQPVFSKLQGLGRKGVIEPIEFDAASERGGWHCRAVRFWSYGDGST